MGNEFQNQAGFLDWQFMVEEYPVDDTYPVPPKTGDTSRTDILIGIMVASAVGLVVLLILMNCKREEKEDRNV